MKKESPMQLVTKQSKLGSPSTKPDPVIVNEIIEWIAHGNTLRSYCRQKNKPNWRTIYNWLEKDDGDFIARFAHARERGAEMIGESILESLNEPPRMIGEDEQRIDPAWVQLKRVKADVTLRLLSKWSSR